MSFAQFLIELIRLLEGDESSPTDLPVATLQQIISLAEKRIYREVRSRYNLKSFAAAIVEGVATPLAVTNNLAPIPDDLESTDVMHFGKRALLPVPDDWLREYNQGDPTGDCIYFAEVGASFTFAPSVADDTLVEGSYFCRLPALDAATVLTNTLFINEYDLFIYASLAEGAPIFKKFADVPMWEAKYAAVRDRVNRRASNAAYSAGRIQMRPSTRLMR